MNGPNLFPRLVESAVLAGATVECWFSEGACTPAEARTRGFMRIGNIVGCTPQVETQGIDSFASIRGRRRLLKHTETQLRRSYQLDNNILDLTALAIEYRGDKETGFTQEAYAAAAVDDMDFSAAPSVANKGYPLQDTGKRVRQVTTVTIVDSAAAELTEDTDFSVDKVHGMIFFLTKQELVLTVTVTAAAIDETSEHFENALTPDAVGIRSGYASIYIYDQYDANSIHHRHEEFSCLIRPQAPTQRDSDSEESRTQLVLEQTWDPGTVFVRRANASAPYPTA